LGGAPRKGVENAPDQHGRLVLDPEFCGGRKMEAVGRVVGKTVGEILYYKEKGGGTQMSVYS